jgi:hypothetical protein
MSPVSSLAHRGLGASWPLLLVACGEARASEVTPKRSSPQDCRNLIAVVSNHDRVSLNVYNGYSVIGTVGAGSTERFAVVGKGVIAVAAAEGGRGPERGVKHNIRYECSE